MACSSPTADSRRPNRLGAWEHARYAANAHLDCAALARETRLQGTSATDFFDQLQQLTGQSDAKRPPPQLAPGAFDHGTPDAQLIRDIERRTVGYHSLLMRESLGEAAAMKLIEAWGDTPAPKLHKLSYE